MALKKTISGIRGTIGKQNNGDNLTPPDIVQFTAAYCTWLKENNNPHKIVLGRDARISGPMVSQLVANTCVGMGIDVVDLGLSTTPTVEMAVEWENAGGGIIITASHNPKEYNALKLLNAAGEFLGHQEAQRVLDLAEGNLFDFAEVDDLGQVSTNNTYLNRHIDAIIADDLVDAPKIKAANFSILVDGVNSSGGVAVPLLLERLGVNIIHKVNCKPTGIFAHNPEPLPAHLTEVCDELVKNNADLGIVVDPDVDRLCFINEDGTLFGEEYTLVAIADYILQSRPGNTVSNLSSTIALRNVTQRHGGQYSAAAVGEVNVVKKMKAVNAVIGGEGNGGVIYPPLHYGRDALAGIALFLTYLAETGKTMIELRAQYPTLIISKNKMQVDTSWNIPDLIDQLSTLHDDKEQNREDGLKIYFAGNDWVHLRESNTEPIIRIYSESESEQQANNLAEQIKTDFQSLL